MLENFKKLNITLGWLVFAIATTVYFLTLEPTASFWDCGEYIATSVKLQVGHPPGAPLFQLVGNFMSQFAFGDVSRQALMVNAVSALSSSFTILFLFWTITYLAKKLALKSGELTSGKAMAILGSGAVGALAYTFSDSFWFSAVEGEVYAMSSFITAATFWMVLKWEGAVDTDKYANRWLVLIAFMVGLSVGVHILVFLIIPAIGMVYYFKLNPNPTTKGFVIANIASMGVLGFVFAVLIPFMLKLFGSVELAFVNKLGLPFNVGTIFTVIILTVTFVLGLRVTHKDSLTKKEENRFFVVGIVIGAIALITFFLNGDYKNGILSAVLLMGFFFLITRYHNRINHHLVNQAILAIVFIMIGYSSFLTLAVRSNANTPIDENNPEDAMSLLAYYNREQYGDWPKLYGKSFNATVSRTEPYLDGNPAYQKGYAVSNASGQEIISFREKFEAEDYIAKSGKDLSIDGRYIVSDQRKLTKPNYDKKYNVFFPRMWSDDGGHVKNYLKIIGKRKTDFYNIDAQGREAGPKRAPTLGENMNFFFTYQLGHMYWRYFMWNFAGRQNDSQGRMELTKGNWISGIKPLDEMRLGPQDNLPSLIKDNPAHNKYYLLPFLLGVFGLVFQFTKDKKDAWSILLFFLFTGAAVVIYTNQKPFEPRERDYAFVGSFYVFAIWIGLGVLGLFELLKEHQKKTGIAVALTAALLVLVPGIMASENWDDHTRANRYTARDVARAYLDSCDDDAILFTNGDNDTFPLWYVQEIEGYRTDVRVVNLSLLNTDWYIDQMKRTTYDGKAVPFSFDWNQYKQGTRDVLYFDGSDPKKSKQRILAQDFIKQTKRDDNGVKKELGFGKKVHTYRYKKLRLPVDKSQVLSNNVVAAKDTAKILDFIDWNLGGSYLAKRDLMVVDLIANNNWERPIYFSITVGNSKSSYFWLTDYFRLEGLAYRFVPIKNPVSGNSYEYGIVDTDIMYDNFMNKYTWGNMEVDGVYLDETNRRLSYNMRNISGRLAKELVKQGENEKAIAVCDRAMEKMPVSKFYYNYFLLGIIEAYYDAGADEKARVIVDGFSAAMEEEIRYYAQFRGQKKKAIEGDIGMAGQLMQTMAQLVQRYEVQTGKIQKNDIQDRFMQISQGL